MSSVRYNASSFGMKTILNRMGHTIGRKQIAVVLLVLLAVFVVTNAAVRFSYRDRTFANVAVGTQKLGGVAYDDIPNRLKNESILPDTLQLNHKDKSSKYTVAELGISADINRIIDEIKRTRPVVPLLGLIGTHHVPLHLNVDEKAFNTSFAAIQKTYARGATDARITNESGKFVIKKESVGYKLEAEKIKNAITEKLSSGEDIITVPTETLQPKLTSNDLKDTLKELQQHQNVQLTYTYQGKSKKASSGDIASWYNIQGAKYELSDTRLDTFLIQTALNFDIRLKNLDQARAATKEALQNDKELTFGFESAPALRTFHYCTAARGVGGGYLAELNSKLHATYRDMRGWSLNGRVSLVRSTSDCDFTVWLSAASKMSSFGAICDADWSCRIGTSVVINFDRWQNASTAWNKSGGSLDDYRSMVINHETGHWFGFGHLHCGAPGQFAPVMQQQSIDLQGCKFNPWPLPSERAALKSALGI